MVRKLVEEKGRKTVGEGGAGCPQKLAEEH